MKKLEVAFGLMLLVLLGQYFWTSFEKNGSAIGSVIRSQYSPAGKKLFADKDKYVLLPNQKSLDITLTARDNYVWKAGWYCKQPCQKRYAWTTFDFGGDILQNKEELRWVNGKEGATAHLVIPREHLKNGKNYVAAYTCEGVNKCNGDKWLLLPLDVLILSHASDPAVSSVYFDFPKKNRGSFFVIVKNNGDIPSPSGTMHYDVQESKTGKKITDGTLVMPSTLSGKTSVSSRVIFSLGEVTNINIHIMLDPEDKLIELDETNNEYSLTKELNPPYPAPPK